MPLTIYPFTPAFAAEIGDVDLARPQPAETVDAIRQALADYAVLVFPDQRLTEAEHLRFAERFGPLETTIAQHRPGVALRVSPQIADVSNLDAAGKIWEADSYQRRHELANRLWHSDSSFKAVPALASLLYARVVPPIGGHTQFSDNRAAYDALPAALREQLAGLTAEHCIRYSRRRIGFDDFSSAERDALPPVLRPLVRRLPESGRMTLYLASHAGRVPSLSDEEGAALIDRLIAHATQPQFVYTHRWRPLDLVIWDNRCTMHRGTAFDDLRWQRDVQRATVADPHPDASPGR